MNEGVTVTRLTDNAYKLKFKGETRLFSNRLEGIRKLWEAFLEEKFTATEALKAGQEIIELPLPSSSNPNNTEEDRGEFKAFLDVFKNKLEAEQDGEPRFFFCSNCGLHAYFAGKDFFYVGDLFSSEEALHAIDWAVSNNKINHTKGLELIAKAEELKFPDESEMYAFMRKAEHMNFFSEE